MKYLIRIVLGVLSLIIALLFILAICFVVQKNNGSTPYIFGYTGFVNTGTSMLPKIKEGDLVIVKKQELYNVNDIISFDNAGLTVTHRIVEVNGSLYKTKGDNNKFTDGDSVSSANVYGKVIKIVPGAGDAISTFYKNKTLILGTLLVLVLGAIGVKVILSVRKHNS